MKSKRFLGIPLITILVFALVATGGVLAAIMVTKTLPGQLVVTPTDYDISLWKDSACTIPATSISWQAKVVGAPVSAQFYIKNEGSKTIYCQVSDNLVASAGDINWASIGSNWVSIQPGNTEIAIGAVTLTPGVTKGTYDLTVTIRGADTNGG